LRFTPFIALNAFVVLGLGVPGFAIQSETGTERFKQEARDSLGRALEPREDRNNSALLYREIFGAMIEAGDADDEDWELFWSERERRPGPSSYRSEAAERLLERNAEILRMAHDATRRRYTDFGLNIEDGFLTPLPHLGPMRQLSRLMELEANNHRANGRLARSAEALSSLLRLSSQTASDGMTINSLVGIATMNSAFDSLEEALARGEFDAAGATIMLDGFDAEDPDPFNIGIAVASEFEHLERTIVGMEETGTEFAEMFDWSGDTAEDSGVGGVRDMDRDAILAGLDACEEGFRLGVQAMEEGDPERARRLVRELEDGIDDGRYGPLASLVMPSYGLLLETKIRANEHRIRYDGILRQIASGTDPGSFGNAALLYEEAFPLLERIEREKQELIDMIRDIVTVTGSCDAIPEQMMRDLRAHLENSAGVIDLLRKAARLRRCEWREDENARRNGVIIPHGRWVRPMRAGIRLLLSNAGMLACLADSDDDHADLDSMVACLIADALSIAMHLGDGSHLMSSAAAAASMSEVVDFAESVLRERDIDVDAVELLEGRFARFDAADPLGWRSAREAMLRREFHAILMRHGMRRRTDAVNLARNWNSERLAAVAFYRSMQEPAKGGLPGIVPTESGDLFDMEDVLFLDEAKLKILARPHRRLIELLEMVDSTEPVPTSRLQAVGTGSLDRMSELIDALADPVREDR